MGEVFQLTLRARRGQQAARAPQDSLQELWGAQEAEKRGFTLTPEGSSCSATLFFIH